MLETDRWTIWRHSLFTVVERKREACGKLSISGGLAFLGCCEEGEPEKDTTTRKEERGRGNRYNPWVKQRQGQAHEWVRGIEGDCQGAGNLRFKESDPSCELPGFNRRHLFVKSVPKDFAATISPVSFLFSAYIILLLQSLARVHQPITCMYISVRAPADYARWLALSSTIRRAYI